MFSKKKQQVKRMEKKSALAVIREYVESFAIALIFALIVMK